MKVAPLVDYTFGQKSLRLKRRKKRRLRLTKRTQEAFSMEDTWREYAQRKNQFYRDYFCSYHNQEKSAQIVQQGVKTGLLSKISKAIKSIFKLL